MILCYSALSILSFGCSCCAFFGIYKDTCRSIFEPVRPFVVDFEVVPVLCTASVLVCHFLVLPNSCWRFIRCFVGTAIAEDDDDDPNRLWYVCPQPAGEDKFMICCDCCHEWYHGECVAYHFHWKLLCLETMKNMCVPYAYNLPVTSLFSSLFQTNPLLLFTGAPATGPEFCDTISYVYDEIVH